jgi:hypothetical protein
LTQLSIRSPRALPTGTRPDAIPPTAAPSANGVRTDEIAETASTRRCSRALAVPDRSAYAVPRRMMPTPAISSGTDSVDAIEPNATGYAVQSTVMTKISQTWLASQTGAMA